MAKWNEPAIQNSPINIDEDMKSLTMEIVAQCLFSNDTDTFAKATTNSVNVVLD